MSKAFMNRKKHFLIQFAFLAIALSSYKIAPRFYMTSAAGGLEKGNSYTTKLRKFAGGILYCADTFFNRNGVCDWIL